MLTVNRPVARIRGQVVDVRPTQNATSGGSSDTDVNEFTASPTGSPAVVGAGDHRHPGGEVAQDLPEPGLVDGAGGRGHVDGG